MKILCEICGKEILDAKKGSLCDYPLGTSYECKNRSGALENGSAMRMHKVRCDKQMCERCATEIAPNMHFCPIHARKAFGVIQVKRWELPPEVMKRI